MPVGYVGTAIEEAAEFLPEGWSLAIEIERGSAVVLLVTPDGETVDCDEYHADGDLSEEIQNAISHARSVSVA